jgi:nucleoprotein TPR
MLPYDSVCLLIQNRCKDVSEQNKLLHQHLESVSSQAARIRQAADSSAAAQAEGDATDDSDTKLVELRQVVQYLRKEKEIVDLQLELCKQENARLKSQVDHLSHALDEARTTLSEVWKGFLSSYCEHAHRVPGTRACC